MAHSGPIPVSGRPNVTPYADPKNQISHPTGPQYHFALSEGTYTLRDEILLGAVPPHPSDVVFSTNVLDTKPLPAFSGTKLTLAVLAPRKPTSFRRRSLNAPSFKSNTFPPSIPESSAGSSQPSSDHGSHRGHGVPAAALKAKFGEGNVALFPANAKEAKDPLKRRKPKNNVTKSSSSFLSRSIPSENMTKRIQEHAAEGVYAFANIGRGLLWLDLSSPNKQDQLMKILFSKAHALCHDFNDLTKTPSHLDVIIGFNTSEFIWYEPMSQKYSRLNKNGVVNPTPVTCVKWIPGSENLFIAAHLDGHLIVYDKEKDEAAYAPEDVFGVPSKVSSDGKRLPRLIVKKSVQSKLQKTNPVSVWKVTNQRINGMAFSPDGKFLALAGEDGSLRILDYTNETLVDLHRSYYGGLTCVAWSPDSAYLLTGGQDDLISIWSAADRELVARCIGHKSWVASVAFDPWHCDETTYRFGSVAEDGRLLLWDFSVGMLSQPRSASIRQSISSYAPPGAERSSSIVTVTPFPRHRLSPQHDPFRTPSPTEFTPLLPTSDDDRGVAHAVLPRAATPLLPPVLSKEVDAHPLSWVAFEEEVVLVGCRSGHVQVWERPGRGDVAG